MYCTYLFPQYFFNTFSYECRWEDNTDIVVCELLQSLHDTLYNHVGLSTNRFTAQNEICGGETRGFHASRDRKLLRSLQMQYKRQFLSHGRERRSERLRRVHSQTCAAY